MDTVFITRGCTNSCHFKGTPVQGEPSVVQQPATSPSCDTAACRKLDGVAAWLMNSVAAVFFTTLERCSCIYIDTKDDLDDHANNYLPLIFSNNNGHLGDNVVVHEQVLQKNGLGD
ncbi:hypothetical protein ACOSQ2_023683 [Xanthoceras sorbifolium]|uniref:Uncharacterized protein n=1 Tax=Xanthoceras sorbifolium TaxID=99658 RepID=A0ABQ8HQV3_9ROSI|nr:hypothetical protein JRO89_XS08G0222600 [Xanthoceras sorbifolium]